MIFVKYKYFRNNRFHIYTMLYVGFHIYTMLYVWFKDIGSKNRSIIKLYTSSMILGNSIF